LCHIHTTHASVSKPVQRHRPTQHAAGRSYAACDPIWIARAGIVALLAAVLIATCVLPATASETVFTAEGKELEKVLDRLRDWIMGIAGAITVLMLTVAGLRYLLGGGDPGETERAKTCLKAAAVGFAIVVLAPVLMEILSGIVKG
ncbi:MAG: pilin, partial [Stackebrandtia sp.]